MTTVGQSRFTAIDFESAGATKGGSDHPVQLGIATWSIETGVTGLFVSYLKTDQPVLWSAQKVHGIGPEQLKDAPPLLSLWPDLRNRLQGAIVVAHGKGTEKRFLRAFPGHGFGPWLDTLQLSRAIWPDLPDHSLSALGSSLELTIKIQAIVPDKFWHDALFDSVASLMVLETAVQSLHLQDTPVAELLHPNTAPWHRLRNS
jgi:DNA polymerase III subunit epsilon